MERYKCVADAIMDLVLKKGCTVSFYPGEEPNTAYISITDKEKRQEIRYLDHYFFLSRCCPTPPSVFLSMKGE